MKIISLTISIFAIVVSALTAQDSVRLTEECLQNVIRQMNILPAEIIYIDVLEIKDPLDELDEATIQNVLREYLAASDRFKLSEADKLDAVLSGEARPLPSSRHDRKGLAVRLDLRATETDTLFWSEKFSCRRYRRLRLSLSTGATLSKAKFSHITFNVFEKTANDYQQFTPFNSSTEIWPPAITLRLELRARTRYLSALVFHCSLARVNLGGVDGKGGGETPSWLTDGTDIRSIGCDLNGSYAVLLGGQWKFSPGRLVGTGSDRFFISLGAGALYYQLNYKLTLTPEYLSAGASGNLSQEVALSGFLPGTVFLFSFDLPVSDHLAAFCDYTQYSATGTDMPRGEPGGAEMFGYQLTIARNRLYTIGIRVIY